DKHGGPPPGIGGRDVGLPPRAAWRPTLADPVAAEPNRRRHRGTPATGHSRRNFSHDRALPHPLCDASLHAPRTHRAAAPNARRDGTSLLAFDWLRRSASVGDFGV